ncbi:MAG: glycosyltransferase [Chakrabartia sp.]
MKIVDVSAFYSPYGGGVRTYVERKFAHAALAGHEMIVVVPGPRDDESAMPGGGRLVSIASPKLIFDGRYRYFRSAGPIHALLDAEQPDIVEASSPWRTANIVAQWQGDARKALIMHADPMSTYAYRWFGQFAERDTIDRRFAPYWNHLRRAARAFDTIICANPSLSERMRAAGLQRVETLALGIEADTFSPALRTPDLRAQLLAKCQLPEHACLLLGVGRLSGEKRWPMVVEAVTRAAARHPVGLVLIGAGRDRGNILRAIGGNPHIKLIEGISDRSLLARIMASADGLVHGCESETFGLVVAEAAAAGLPLILPDQGGATGLAAPDRSLVYQSGNGAALAEAIIAFLRRDRQEMRAAAVRHSPRIASIGDHFDQLFNSYAQLSGQRMVA